MRAVNGNFFSISVSNTSLQRFIQKSDVNKSGDVSLKEFVTYLKEHDKKLRLQFSHLDKNKGNLIAEVGHVWKIRWKKYYEFFIYDLRCTLVQSS